MKYVRSTRRSALFAAVLIAGGTLVPAGLAQDTTGQQAADADTRPAHEKLLEGAERIGEGRVSVWRKGASTILGIPADFFGKPFLWYSEAVSLPSGTTPTDLEVASLLARFELHADRVIVRDLTTTLRFRGGDPAGPGTTTPERTPTPGEAPGEDGDVKFRPIDVALDRIDVGPVMVAAPIAAAMPDGTVLIEITAPFSSDIEAVSARGLVALTGLAAAAPDPAGSYIERVRVFGNNLNIRTHITFKAADPRNPAAGTRPVSVVIGHSLLALPDEPMEGRRFDPNIGFFATEFTDFEARSGAVVDRHEVIARFRLEKKNPDAEVSDPVKPITFYIGPGVPERWRPYMKAAVESWQPVFEAAGFSNAIIALDPPGPEENPDWSAEDVGISVIRWVPREFANAKGPHVVDPRSGETISAHILVWPSVIDTFSTYYFTLFSTLDPDAASLPLSTEKRGELLQYVVAHEVGHSIGLRHNHIASTAYSTRQMRDPAFANVNGPNTSIMAYGRMNQAAQPGDGVTQLYSVHGKYDYAAIKWGYGVFADTAALDAFARRFTEERELFWTAAELPREIERFGYDPRVQRENSGSDRIEATRLGIANIRRTMERLDEATGGDDLHFKAAYQQALGRQTGFLESVASLVGGSMPRFGHGNGGEGDGPLVAKVPADVQREAVRYLLGDGVESLEIFQRPSILERVDVVGGYRAIDRAQGALLAKVLAGDKIAILESQSVGDRQAYSPLDLGADVVDMVWGDLSSAPFSRRALQRAWIAQTRALIASWAGGGAEEAAAAAALQATLGVSANLAAIGAETGDDTIYPAWLRAALPGLQARLRVAADAADDVSDKLHFSDMAVQVGRLVQAMQ